MSTDIIALSWILQLFLYFLKKTILPWPNKEILKAGCCFWSVAQLLVAHMDMYISIIVKLKMCNSYEFVCVYEYICLYYNELCNFYGIMYVMLSKNVCFRLIDWMIVSHYWPPRACKLGNYLQYIVVLIFKIMIVSFTWRKLLRSYQIIGS